MQQVSAASPVVRESSLDFTGHYANKGWSSEDLTGVPRPKLLRPQDRTKDQTYYLSGIPESSLARTIFPIAQYSKNRVKEMAHEWKLPTAARPESMGICFVGEKRRFDTFICKRVIYYSFLQAPLTVPDSAIYTTQSGKHDRLY